ncbi:hypothetical protein CSIM01_13565 [Colletotrichum simmondsii]|uniref:Uncharacterized protein n=1 Tax=Colletotrichum simmondsii TaxID=703756 RepID=A0A135TQW3_9PEZI|nr:hypothetical protein CSIM01_13565 [Colletotrichum simmondsii]
MIQLNKPTECESHDAQTLHVRLVKVVAARTGAESVSFLELQCLYPACLRCAMRMRVDTILYAVRSVPVPRRRRRRSSANPARYPYGLLPLPFTFLTQSAFGLTKER